MDRNDGETCYEFRTKSDSKKHTQFLNDVLSLNKRPQLKKATRTEPTLQISEFNLVKSVTGKEGAIHLTDLTQVLKKRAKHVEIGKKVSSAARKAKTLPRPLEKPRAERIRRTVAFESVKKQLDRWDAVVTSNRATNHLSFPLANTQLENGKHVTGFRLKTELQKELEEIEPKVEIFNLEKESKYPLTMQEMMERRKEMAKMRAVQSYKEAKARRQSKIKSKKYHRIQRRENVKQQLKDFEQLQKSNPAEALKKLEEIERVRAEERASLRHRSTGKWAKNKQVQAKYDKDSRQVLAQQLAISRELTQKIKTKDGDSDYEEELVNDIAVPKDMENNNPWTNPIKASNEIEEFLSGYRKFWETKNKNISDQLENDFKNCDSPKENYSDNLEIIGTTNEQTETSVDSSNITEISNHVKELEEMKQDFQEVDCFKQKMQEVDNDSLNNSSKKIKHKVTRSKKQLKNVATIIKRVGTTNWEVNLISDNDSNEEIDSIFDNFDEKVKKTVEKKYKKLKKLLEQQNNHKPLKHKAKQNCKAQIRKNKKLDLSFPRNPSRPVIDEQLLETKLGETEKKNNLALLQAVLINGTITNVETPTSKTSEDIDPNDIIKTRPINLNTEIPDLLTLEDNEENVNQKGTISEAFEDDNIIAEFSKDKKNEIEGEKPKDVNFALPGWGLWGGTGIKASKRKNKRFILKFPKKFKRRDDNKGNLIINEKANVKIKSHLVSEVPFPFKKVKDFEASIRAPIGNTFVPETAYRKTIRPAVRTKMGTVIEPMTDEILLKKK